MMKALLSLCLLVAIPSFADSGGDIMPSGVSTEAIQLPKPAGSVQGFGGEAASVGNTGAATYSIQIEVPKGRNGLQPALSLNYNSATGSGPFGIGWSLSVSSIERSNLRGVPRYINSDLITSTEDGELINIGDEQYRPYIDKNQSRYSYDETNDTWTRFEANGIVHHYGMDAESRVATWAGTYRWLLKSTVDPFGNRIEYFYDHDGGQAYVTEIRYADLYSIQFGYSDRPDRLVGYGSTQAVSTRLRCSDIWVRANQLIRHYKLSYQESPNGKVSRLWKVRLLGRDDLTAYPDLAFSYFDDSNPVGLKSKAAAIDTSGAKPLPPSLSNPRVTLADLNGDGLTDILETREDGAVVWPGGYDGRFEASYRLPNLRGVLGTKNTKLLDVDGDRKVDFVGSGLYPQFWPGDGNGSFTAPVPITNFPRYSVGSSAVRTFDVNGDGKMDLVAQEPDQIWVFFNGGDGRWDRRVKITYNEPGTAYPVFNFSAAHTFFSDLNGDGLTDIAYVDLNRVYYYPNRGNGYWDEPVVMNFDGIDYAHDCATPTQCVNPPPILREAQYQKAVFLADINADGLADLLVALSNGLMYAYNRGDGTFSQSYSITDIHAGALDPAGLKITTADMNGNGSQDVVWSNDFGDIRYFDFNDAKPNLLIEIRNGLGKRTVIEYLPHNRYGTSALVTDSSLKVPFPVHTVKSIKVFGWDKLASENQFNYFGGFYNGSKNEFHGFQLIEKLQPGDDSVPDSIERRFFEIGQASAKNRERGLIVGQEVRRTETVKNRGAYWVVRSQSPVLKAEAHEYQTFEVAAGLYGENVGMPLETKKTEIEGDETGAKRSWETAVSYSFENAAVKTKNSVHFDDAGSRYREIADTFAHAVDPSSGLWNVSNLAQRELRDAAGSTVQSTRFFFDNLVSLGAVTKGKITKQEKLSNGLYVTKNRYGWTVDGNLSWFEDAAAHRTVIGYDPTYRIFPTKVTNPKGHVQSVVYDWNRGVISSATDVNGNSTLYFYDPFLRVSKVFGPYKDAALADYSKPALEVVYAFGNESGNPSSILTKKRTDIAEATTIDTKAHFDPLGRSIGSIASGPAGKFIHSGGSEFNTRGKVKKKYLPFFVSGLDDYTPDLTRPFIRLEFDTLDREAKSYNPEHTDSNPSVKSTVYRVGETQLTDEMGKATKNQFDFLGRLTSVINAKNHATHYSYTISNQLERIVDAKGSQTLFQYDSLDRRICKLDPNIGKTVYGYSDLDLLTEKRDFGFEAGVTTCAAANLRSPRITQYEYADALNRITKTTFLDGSTAPIQYFYDQGIDGLGRLTATTFEIGSKALSYDLYGNVTRTDYMIDGEAFRVDERKDILGRVREVRYPDALGIVLRVGYEYDESGNLSRVFNLDTGSNFANGLAYNELNQIHALEFGNGVRTRMNYDVGQGSYRLTDILTYKGAATGDNTPIDQACASSSSIQCLGYAYDKVSNITEISDYLNRGSIQTSSIREFQYDDIHQLTHAVGPWGVQDFTYDPIGNITSKGSVQAVTKTGIGWIDLFATKAKSKVPGVQAVDAYSYDPSRPQILTRVGATSYAFDAYGNLNQVGSDKGFTFDSMNRMKAFSGAVPTGYFYDENGDRVLKRDASGKVIFASRYFEKRKGQYFRYVFAGTRRLAVVKGEPGEVQYIHPDHLGSSNFVTNAAGETVLRREFAPFGEVVVDAGADEGLKNQYTDKYRDDESALSYFGARYYIPNVGRWASADPKYRDQASLSGLQSWGFVLNKPLTLFDPDGHDPAAFSSLSGANAYFNSLSQQFGAYLDHARENISGAAGTFGSMLTQFRPEGFGVYGSARGELGGITSVRLGGDIGMSGDGPTLSGSLSAHSGSARISAGGGLVNGKAVVDGNVGLSLSRGNLTGVALGSAKASASEMRVTSSPVLQSEVKLGAVSGGVKVDLETGRGEIRGGSSFGAQGIQVEIGVKGYMSIDQDILKQGISSITHQVEKAQQGPFQ